MIKFKIISRKNIPPLVLVFLIVFYNMETFPSRYYDGPIDTIIILTFIFIIFFLMNVFLRKISINLRSIIILPLLFSSIFITMIVNSNFRGGYFVVLLSIFLGFLVIHLVPFDTFTELYVQILVVLAVYSILALYLLNPIIHVIPDILFPRFANTSGIPMINARLTYIVDVDKYFRNFGIFREPGVYQVFLNIALMFELFYKRTKPNTAKLIVLYSAIISTFSSPGYISAVILTFAHVVSVNKMLSARERMQRKRLFMQIFIGGLIAAIVLSQISELFNRNIASAFNKLGNQASLEVRTTALLSNIVIWTERPIFGHGIESGLEQRVVMEIRKNLLVNPTLTIHNTSTIGALLSAFGLIFTLLYIYLMYRLIRNSYQPGLIKILIFLAIMVTINTQLLIYNELLYVILVYGLTRRSMNYSVGHAESSSGVSEGIQY